FTRILRGLADNAIIEQIPTGELILALRGERLTAEHDFYAAFASNEIFTVRNDDEMVGEMPADSVPPVGQCFILNGRRWEVREVGTREKTVWVRPTRQRVPPLFAGEGGDVDNRIFEVMRELLNSDDVPPFIDPAARLLLASARAAACGSGAAESGIVITDSSILWYPWTGTRAFRTLRLLLAKQEIDHQYDELSIRFRSSSMEEFGQVLDRIEGSGYGALELAAEMEVKTFDKYDDLLPPDVIDEMNALDRIDLQSAGSCIRQARAALPKD
ncbi:MAG TPA: hypothetical protein VEB66_17155, partial [Opitutaceae bacterium]|nr:hypothetical protein [Opitutaceae bacterium]